MLSLEFFAPHLLHLEVTQLLIQIRQASCLVIDLLHGFGLIFDDDLVEPLLPSHLILVELSRELRLSLDFFVRISDLSF